MAKWYFKIYDWMIEDLHLKGAELLVFAYLYMWSENGKECTQTQGQIADKLGISRQAYISAIDRIVKKLDNADVKKLDTKCKETLHKNVKKLDTKCKETLQLDVKKLDNTINKNNKRTLKEKAKDARAYTREGEVEVITLKDVILTEWMSHYQRSNGTSYIPDFRETTTDTELIADAIKVKMAECGKDADSTDEQREFCAALFDAMYGVADNWQRSNWTLHTIATQFNRLFNQIRNGQRTDNNGGRSSDAAFRASIARYLTGAE